MNAMFQHMSGSNEQVRRALYEGAIYLLPANAASKEFVGAVLELVCNELGDEYRRAHEIYDDAGYFSRIGSLRKIIYKSSFFYGHLNRVVESCGFNAKQQAFDPARLRAVASNGHLNPRAAPLYYGHRDTWYANPQSMLTWWIPLHDVNAKETFEFYPEYFDRPVANDSEIFDFDEWIADGEARRIGWQNTNTGHTANYPSLKETTVGDSVSVVANKADILIFSAQHLHKTLQNHTNQTRFSLDFRTVEIDDMNNGIEAKNVDNRSTGSAVMKFVRTGTAQKVKRA